MNNFQTASKTIIESERSYKGFNLFDDEDQLLFEAIASGEFTISGFQNKHLRDKLPGKSSAQISRTIKRLHVHGLIRKIGHTYKYYLSKFGSQLITMGLKLKELVIIPLLLVTWAWHENLYFLPEKASILNLSC